MQSKPYRGCRPYPAGKNRNLLVLSPLKLVIIVSLALFSPASIWAQLGGTGTIEGTVTDPSGAVVPGAKVTGRNVATRAEVVRITTSSGLYTLAPLDAGDYVVTITAPGFETLVRENIHVDGMQVLALNLNMRMGSANQTVTVTSAPPQLDTSSAWSRTLPQAQRALPDCPVDRPPAAFQWRNSPERMPLHSGNPRRDMWVIRTRIPYWTTCSGSTASTPSLLVASTSGSVITTSTQMEGPL